MLSKYISVGEPIPKWYGVSYTLFDRDGAVCHPIPLNKLVAWFQRLRTRLKMWKPDARQKALADQYREGQISGRSQLFNSAIYKVIQKDRRQRCPKCDQFFSAKDLA